MVLQTTYIVVEPCRHCLRKYGKKFLNSKKDVETFWLSEDNFDMNILSLGFGTYMSRADFLRYVADTMTNTGKRVKLEVRYGKNGEKICFIDEKGDVK